MAAVHGEQPGCSGASVQPYTAHACRARRRVCQACFQEHVTGNGCWGTLLVPHMASADYRLRGFTFGSFVGKKGSLPEGLISTIEKR